MAKIMIELPDEAIQYAKEVPNTDCKWNLSWDDIIKAIRNSTADVVERSKIDKAIECIGNLNLNDYGDNLYQFQNKVIEIVRSIGE